MIIQDALSKLPIKRYLVVGSAVVGIRLTNDIDVICYEEDITVPYSKANDYSAVFIFEGYKVDCLLANKQESLQLILDNPKYNQNGVYATAILKAGHIVFDSKNWENHIVDYTILTNYVIGFDEDDQRLIKLHRICTENRLKETGSYKNKPKLKGKTYEEFMDDGVTKVVDHDKLHEIVAFTPGIPLYKSILKDPTKNSVECSEEKFNNLSDEEKLKLVVEESMVIALERVIIPAILKCKEFDEFEAYKYAVRKVCVSLSSNWFQQFAIDNYFNVLNTRINFVQKLKDSNVLETL